MGALRGRAAALACPFLALAVLLALPGLAAGITRHYTFNVRMTKVTRLCGSKSIPTVNGQFPGPPKLVAREGDRVVVKVHNHINYNVSFHWHGLRQLRNGWADGPSYITQCPIQPGQSYTYDFTVAGQRGTLWWHAHFSWLRVHLYGPLLILPSRSEGYPFQSPHKEVPIMFGEWFKADTETVINQALQTGAGPNVSDAYTFNGFLAQPITAPPKYGKPGSPRLNEEIRRLYFFAEKVCKLMHVCPKTRTSSRCSPGQRTCSASSTPRSTTSSSSPSQTTRSPVVEADANYVKPFTATTLVISPGQTMNVLLTASTNPASQAFAMASPRTPTPRARSTTPPPRPFSSTTPDHNTADLRRNPKPASAPPGPAAVQRHQRRLHFLGQLPEPGHRAVPGARAAGGGPARALHRRPRHGPVPAQPDLPGPQRHQVRGVHQQQLLRPAQGRAPRGALPAALYAGVLMANFPTTPPHPFNYTGTAPNNTFVAHGTRVVPLAFNTSVELVMQGTAIQGAESHPLHMHGSNFFVVGQGFGDYDPVNDPAKYNLVDPSSGTPSACPPPAGSPCASSPTTP
ncbi:hypothetical protein ACQ4PT_071849 [Festuca glaucescens]